jgi:hypothetical protein
VVSNDPFLTTKANGLFAHQSSAKDDLHGKAITLLRDGFTSTLVFFLFFVFYFYFSSIAATFTKPELIGELQ